MNQDLITRVRVLSNLNNLNASAGENTTLDLLIRAVSRAVQRYCRREFALRNHDELHNGNGGCYLYLKRYPVVAVDRVATRPEAVLTVTNTSAANQRATVQVTGTGLTLVRVANGTTVTDASVTWASNVTLSAVAAAITSLGNGWGATAAPGHGGRASADLRPIQGALNAKGIAAELRLHTEELNAYEVDAGLGCLILKGGWQPGVGNYRVVYTAGYETVPEDVQEACAEWVAALFWQTKRDAGLSQEQIPGTVSRTPVLNTRGMPPHVKVLLAPYRKLWV
jgi:hypothetical protein